MPRIVAWIRRTVERRKESYAGGNPIAEGAAFVRRVDAGAAEVLKRWLTVRWYRVGPDFRDVAAGGEGDIAGFVPAFARLPATAALAGKEDRVGALEALLARFYPVLQAVRVSRAAEPVSLHARLVIAADAASATTMVRRLDRVDCPVPVLQMPRGWQDDARAEAVLRKAAGSLAERLMV